MPKRTASAEENVPPSRFKTGQQFDFTLDDDDFEEMAKGYTPKNTETSTSWALNTFETWMERRNAEKGKECCPADLLSTNDKASISRWLARFVTEARRRDGKPYPPKTIHMLLMGLQRHMRILQPSNNINIFTDPEYHVLKNVCDSFYRKLHSSGIGTEVKATIAVSSEDENRLWSSGVINLTTPQGLANAVFFYNGKNFCLRGGQEHRDLKFSQLTRKVIDIGHGPQVSYEYVEHGSKNRSGGIKQMNMTNKAVVQYEDEQAGERCHVHILDMYFMKVPKDALLADIFYLQPLSQSPKDPTKPWFTRQPMGRNKLSQMMKSMSADAGLSQQYTNHSLRAFGATKMFQEGLPEKLIQERTGHRSAESLRQYQRTSEEQKIMASHSMNGTLADNLKLQPTSHPATQQLLPCTSSAIQPAAQQIFSYHPSTRKESSFVGCSFQGCSITINIVQQPPTTEDHLQGIDINDLFGDL